MPLPVVYLAAHDPAEPLNSLSEAVLDEALCHRQRDPRRRKPLTGPSHQAASTAAGHDSSTQLAETIAEFKQRLLQTAPLPDREFALLESIMLSQSCRDCRCHT